MTDSGPASLRALVEAVARQVAAIEADVKARYDDWFVETGTSSVQFGDAAIGARLPAGMQNVSAGYRSGLGGSGNQPPDAAVALVEWWARAADVLAEMQDRIAGEGYLDTARERRSRRERLIDLALGALVGIAVWQAVCFVARGSGPQQSDSEIREKPQI